VGTGIIPRDDATITRLVGGFNGGWQTVHGEFGMMSDGKLIARPLPFCATAARFLDGSFGMGSWPNDNTLRDIPSTMQSFRQNLFAIVENNKFDPFGRKSWGGGPGFITGVGPTTHIIRSGLCLRKDGYPVYAWGTSLTGETLARAMIAAGCEYGMELDINAGHAGFEFYRIMPAPAGGVPKLGHFEVVKLEKNFATVGIVPGRPDLMYAMRRLSRHMGIQPFPRYIGRDWRDFMYLTLRPVLPGEPLAPVVTPPLPGEGRFVVAPHLQGPMPHPPAVATSFLRPDASRPDVRVALMRIDLWRVDVGLTVGEKEPESTLGVDLRQAQRDPQGGQRLAVIPLGLSDPLQPRGIALGTRKHFPLRPGLDTVAILEPLRTGGPPRVLVGKWGVDVKAVDGETAAVVQGDAVSLASQGERRGRRGAAFSSNGAGGADVAHPDLAARGHTPQAVGVCLDRYGFLFVAAAPLGEEAALRSALGHAGCPTAAVFRGVGSPWVREANGGWRSLGDDTVVQGLPLLKETRLVVTAQPRWPAFRIFTQQGPEKRAVWSKILGPKGKSAQRVHGPATPDVQARQDGRSEQSR